MAYIKITQFQDPVKKCKSFGLSVEKAWQNTEQTLLDLLPLPMESQEMAAAPGSIAAAVSRWQPLPGPQRETSLQNSSKKALR